MAFRRFFVEPDAISEAGVWIGGDLFHHIREVCRFKEGDRFEVLSGDNQAWLVEVDAVEKRQLHAKRISVRTLPELKKPFVTLALSVPKLPKVDWIVEKGVELGVFALRPFVSDYSFLRKASEITPNRVARWEKIAESATQQSGRGDLLKIHPAVTLDQLFQEFNRQESVMGLFPYEGESPVGLSSAISEIKRAGREHLWVFVGSEGGFSLREVEMFESQGMKPVSMGDQILRVETACLALVSILKYESGALR